MSCTVETTTRVALSPAGFASAEEQDEHRRRRGWGVALGWVAAFCYTAANICLRRLAGADPIWISCIKALPTIILVLPWLLARVVTRKPLVRSPASVAVVVGGALVGQFAGNCVFQWALGVVGLALAVPVTLVGVLIGSALLGGRLLGESVTVRTWLSIGILIASVFILGLGAPEAYRSLHHAAPASAGLVVLGVASFLVAGFAYSSLGATIRHAASRGVPLPTILMTSAVVGVAGLGSVVVLRHGWLFIAQTPAQHWNWGLAAGLFNGLAFSSLAIAIHWIGLLNVNALNASQSAMAALAGVVLFAEPVTGALILGCLLTVAGLLTMPRS